MNGEPIRCLRCDGPLGDYLGRIICAKCQAEADRKRAALAARRSEP